MSAPTSTSTSGSSGSSGSGRQGPQGPQGQQRGERESAWSKGPTRVVLQPLIVAAVAWVVALELLLYGLVRAVVWTYESARHARETRALAAAQSLPQWTAAARALDSVQGKDPWRARPDSKYYDHGLLERLCSKLRAGREALDAGELGEGEREGQGRKVLKALGASLRPNVGGFENEELYSHTFSGTKDCVQAFADEVAACLDWAASSDLPGLRSFAEVSRREFGESALALSGGAAFAYPHFGVVRCLLQRGVLPRVVSGTSCGSLVASIACTRTDAELAELLERPEELAAHLRFNVDSSLDKLRRLGECGHVLDYNAWVSALVWATCGETTFAEAFAKTGRVLNITVVGAGFARPSHTPRLLNYITTPNVLIYSAIAASAAMPLATGPIKLLCRNEETGAVEPFTDLASTNWRDGSLKTDIPLDALQQHLNVKFAIVSQCNPHVVPFFFGPRGTPGRPALHLQGHGFRGGFLWSCAERFLKLDLLKWAAFVRELDLLPTLLGQDWGSLFLQRFGGTVTLVRQARFGAFLRCLSDPSAQEMADYIAEGERMTWPALVMIENHMRIEKALERLCQRLLPPSASAAIN
eukprot:m51a1_g11440 hypothetical protein (586) ;mRNA; f:500-2747